MCATILWTINDFPAYANLSGWSTKGKFSYPICNKNCLSYRLQMNGNGVTWVIVDFYRPIIDFDMIKGHLMEMRSIEQHPNNCLQKMFYINYMEWNILF